MYATEEGLGFFPKVRSFRQRPLPFRRVKGRTENVPREGSYINLCASEKAVGARCRLAKHRPAPLGVQSTDGKCDQFLSYLVSTDERCWDSCCFSIASFALQSGKSDCGYWDAEATENNLALATSEEKAGHRVFKSPQHRGPRGDAATSGKHTHHTWPC